MTTSIFRHLEAGILYNGVESPLLPFVISMKSASLGFAFLMYWWVSDATFILMGNQLKMASTRHNAAFRMDASEILQDTSAPEMRLTVLKVFDAWVDWFELTITLKLLAYDFQVETGDQAKRARGWCGYREISVVSSSIGNRSDQPNGEGPNVSLFFDLLSIYWRGWKSAWQERKTESGVLFTRVSGLVAQLRNSVLTIGWIFHSQPLIQRLRLESIKDPIFFVEAIKKG